jgi:tetratricopeptide (TPR) repeat protein
VLLRLVAFTFLAIALLSAPPALADDSQEAEKLNEQGKTRIKQLDLEGAAEFFRRAIQLSPDPRYYFNLCYTLEKSGKLEAARQACDAVSGTSDERLENKAAALSAKIDEKLGPRPTEPTPPVPDPANDKPPPEVGPRPVPPPPMKPVKDPNRMLFGAVFGFVSANLVGDGPDANASFGFALGSWALLPLTGGLSMVFEGQYVQRGAAYEEVGLGRISFDNNYLDFGAAARYGVGSTTSSYYGELGVTASLLLSSTGGFEGDVVDTDVNPKDLAWSLGLGSRFGAIDLRFRFMSGLLNVNATDDSPTGDSASIFNRTLFFQGGYWY